MFSSNTVTLPEGIEIHFTDSGPVPNSGDYTTLIILHGSAFNGHGFERLHAFAHEFNLRTIIWNRRDYAGSTKYTDAELDDLNNGRKVFLDRLSIQMSYFLKYFIDAQRVPKVSANRKTGGFTILGWSMGTATAMPLFSDPTLIPTTLYDELELYVKDLVLYDPPYLSFGYPLPEGEKTYDPWTDPNCKTPEELFRNFKTWVSSYYDGHNVSSGSINSLDFRKGTDRATVSTWTPEQQAKFFDEGAAVRSELRMYTPPMQPTLHDLTKRVLFDKSLTRSLFPKVAVTYIACKQSQWHSIWGEIELRKDYEQHLTRGDKVRSICFLSMEGENHFVHWDNPKALLMQIVRGIRS